MMSFRGAHRLVPVFIFQQAVATKKLPLHHRCPGIIQVEGRNLQPVCDYSADLWGEETHNSSEEHCGSRDRNPTPRARPTRDRRPSNAIDQLRGWLVLS